MSFGLVVANRLLARHILAYIVNFWETPRLVCTCRLTVRILLDSVRLFYGAYLQIVEHECDRDEARCNALATACFERQGLIF